MAYKLNLGVWGSVFAVPSCVADSLKVTNGDHIKVLLYILRNPGALLTNEEVAAATGVGIGTVSDALIYWKNMNVIAENGDEIIPAEGNPPRTTDRRAAEVKVALTAEPQFPPKVVAKTVNDNQAFKYLCQTFERLSGRPTKHTERNTLMVLTEEIGLPSEVVIMLVEYCFSIDKATPAYMKSVALDWFNSGIDTISKAEERILALKTRNTLEERLRIKFRMTSAFSAKQKEIIAGWAEMGISDELIDEAYDKTLNSTGKLSFPYMDSILRSWTDKGITAAEQLTQDKPAASANTSGAMSFDVADLEQSSYERYRKKK
ncbi:MAG: DnaD domain protein [Ruminiclostridium sp.]|nr:DnaD domain protein [Ruminiclostridium sp.]